MKEIWAIIRREKYAETKRALDKVGCGAMSVHSVWGRGKQGGFIMSEAESELALYATSAPKLVPTPSYLVAEGATITKPVVYVPKKLLVMVLPDDKVEKAIEAIIEVNRTGHYGDGKIFVLPVEDAITIRTGKGEKKLLQEGDIMKAIFRKNSNGHIEVYIPKKDIEAIVVDIQKSGSWGGIFKLSNGWVLEVPSFESEPRFPITIEVKKIGE